MKLAALPRLTPSGVMRGAISDGRPYRDSLFSPTICKKHWKDDQPGAIPPTRQKMNLSGETWRAPTGE